MSITSILYSHFSSKRFNDIRSIEVDGSNETIIISNPAIDGKYYDYISARYNSNRSKLALLSTFNHPNGLPNVFIFDIATASLTQITFGDRDFSCVDWMPDDSQLLVSALDDNGGNQIQLMKVDGTGLLPLTTGAFEHFSAKWSPDGSRILYDQSLPWPNRDAAIWVMDANGTSQIQLTIGNGYAADPCWSPDGSSIVYTYAASGGQLHICKMNLATGNISSLTQPPTGFGDHTPIWSAAGIVFSRSTNPTGTYETGGLYIMDTSGGNLRNLTQPVDAFDHASDG